MEFGNIDIIWQVWGVYQKVQEKYEYHPFLGSNDIRIDDYEESAREQLFVQCVVLILVSKTVFNPM